MNYNDSLVVKVDVQLCNSASPKGSQSNRSVHRRCTTNAGRTVSVNAQSSGICCPACSKSEPGGRAKAPGTNQSMPLSNAGSSGVTRRFASGKASGTGPSGAAGLPANLASHIRQPGRTAQLGPQPKAGPEAGGLTRPVLLAVRPPGAGRASWQPAARGSEKKSQPLAPSHPGQGVAPLPVRDSGAAPRVAPGVLSLNPSRANSKNSLSRQQRDDEVISNFLGLNRNRDFVIVDIRDSSAAVTSDTVGSAITAGAAGVTGAADVAGATTDSDSSDDTVKVVPPRDSRAGLPRKTELKIDHTRAGTPDSSDSDDSYLNSSPSNIPDIVVTAPEHATGADNERGVSVGDSVRVSQGCNIL